MPSDKVRNKVCNLKFATEDVELWDSWAREHGLTRTVLIEMAVERLIAGPSVLVPKPKPEITVESGPMLGMTGRERRAFICNHKDCKPPRRVFLAPDEPGRIPECPEHGLMIKQENRPYKQ